MADALTTREVRVTLAAGDAAGDLRDRLRRTRLPAADGEGWERGVPRSWLAALLDDWASFDTAAFQARLDGLIHREAAVDGQLIHLVHVPGRGPDPLPLLLTHGWPGSFCEYLDLIPLLADPAAHGGDPADAFTVVVPSLPGFGFSAAPPPGGLTPAKVAALWHRLMTEGLGYPRFAAHGSDLGAGVTAWLARDFPAAVAGIHLATPGLAAPPRPWSPAEEAFLAGAAAWTAEEGGYAHEQATKPSTLGAALHDSPAGLAAWIGEKVTAWSAVTGDGQPAFGRDLLLGTLTLYWVTGPSRRRCCPTGPTPTTRRRDAGRGAAGGAHGDQHLRRRAGPVPQAAPGAGRTVLPAGPLGRARPGRPLPGGGRARAAGPDAPRRVPASAERPAADLIMNPEVVRYSERPEPREGIAGLSAEVWPEYNLPGDMLNQYWDQLREI
ncbi:MAG: epoxide hydrolase family protein [Streptosporangiaceae bacterium]